MSVYSYETTRNPRETRPDAHPRSQLVRAAGVRHDGRRSLRGSHVAHVEPQVIKRTRHHLYQTRDHDEHGRRNVSVHGAVGRVGHCQMCIESPVQKSCCSKGSLPTHELFQNIVVLLTRKKDDDKSSVCLIMIAFAFA